MCSQTAGTGKKNIDFIVYQWVNTSFCSATIPNHIMCVHFSVHAKQEGWLTALKSAATVDQSHGISFKYNCCFCVVTLSSLFSVKLYFSASTYKRVPSSRWSVVSVDSLGSVFGVVWSWPPVSVPVLLKPPTFRRWSALYGASQRGPSVRRCPM